MEISLDKPVPEQCRGCDLAAQCVAGLNLARRHLIEAAERRMATIEDIEERIQDAIARNEADEVAHNTIAREAVARGNEQIYTAMSGALERDEKTLAAGFAACTGFDEMCGLPPDAAVAVYGIQSNWHVPKPV